MGLTEVDVDGVIPWVQAPQSIKRRKQTVLSVFISLLPNSVV